MINDKQKSMPNLLQQKKPGRPLGVVVAVFFGLLVFTIIPLIQVGFTLRLRNTIRDSATINIGGSEIFLGGALGFANVTDLELIARVVPAALYLVVAVFSWRGRPSRIRTIFNISSISLAAWYIGLDIFKRVQSQSFIAATEGFSAPSPASTLQNGWYILMVLILCYMLWYMNRGPARAFYRGYYLPAPNTIDSDPQAP